MRQASAIAWAGWSEIAEQVHGFAMDCWSLRYVGEHATDNLLARREI